MSRKILIVLILAVLISACGSEVEGPTFFRDLNDNPAEFEEAINSAKYVIVFYWELSCPFCMEELPYMDMIHKFAFARNAQYGWEVLNVIGMNVEDTTDDVALIMGKGRYFFASFVGAELPKAARGVPHIEIYARGSLVRELSGLHTDKEIMDIIAEVIKETNSLNVI